MRRNDEARMTNDEGSSNAEMTKMLHARFAIRNSLLSLRVCLELRKHEIGAPLMRAPSRYKTIAVATTFSPRFRHVLAESKRLWDRFRADLHLAHVGRCNDETAKKFSDALAQR